MKFYGLLLAGTLLASSLFAQNKIESTGDVGIGTLAPHAPLHVRQASELGGTLNDSQLILRLHGESSNNFYQSIWLRRDAAGSSWYTARIHDGISIDASYQQPGVNTKTWWERDPYNNIQSWGTGSSAIMTLRNSRLGIGTDDPQYKLHVMSDDILLKRGSGTSLHFRTDGTNSYINNMDNFVNNGASGNGKLIITAQTDFYFRTGNAGSSGTDRLIINENGNVGVGLNTPTEKLDVDGNIRLRGDNGTIKFYRSTNAIDIANISYNNQESSFSFSANNKDLVFNSQLGFTESMRIKSNGNVGIGTETPSNKLDVNGTIHAKEVVVDLNFPGPDYVFEEDYPLQDLTSLDQYLKDNKHLPEVPSAAQMEKEGVNMMEMQMLLLKKVEELTLQLIKQNKEIQALKSELNN